MTDDDREHIQIDRLSEDQRELLETYLRGAAIPFELTTTTVSVESQHFDDLYSALEIVGNAKEQPPSDVLTALPPLVVERPVIVCGQTVASPTRRFAGAVIDFVILNVAIIVADRAGLPPWFTVAANGLYIVFATAFTGRTIGKLLSGTKVISTDHGRPPGLVNSFIRWLVVYWGDALELMYGTWPIGVATAIFVARMLTYAPIIWDLRCQGWHDRLAKTVVVVAPMR